MPAKIRGKWCANVHIDYPEGRRRVRLVSPVQSKRGALEYEKKLIAEAAVNCSTSRSYGRRKARRFDEFVTEFLKPYETDDYKYSTAVSYEYICRVHLLPAFGSMQLAEIKRHEVDRYRMRKQDAELSPKTINNQLGVLSKALNTAVEWEYLSRAPVIKRCTVEESEPPFLSFEEADRLLDAARADEEHWFSMVTLALRTGLRIGELIALRWDDCDLSGRKLVVARSETLGVESSPKNRKTRSVPLSTSALQAIASQRHLRGPRVFCKDDGNPYTTNNTYWPLWRICRVAGLPEFGWHRLRHTFAAHMVSRGVPMKIVSEHLGHKSLRMTEHYSHLVPEVDTSAVDLLDEPWRTETNWHKSGTTPKANPLSRVNSGGSS